MVCLLDGWKKHFCNEFSEMRGTVFEYERDIEIILKNFSLGVPVLHILFTKAEMIAA